MEPSPYPRLLYRDGTTERVWNLHDVDFLTVHSADEEREAIAMGWRRSPAPDAPEIPIRRGPGRPRKTEL
jgi:hypothetical protein